MSVPTKRISYTCTTYEEANTQISDDQSHVNQTYSLETLAVAICTSKWYNGIKQTIYSNFKQPIICISLLFYMMLW